MAVCAWFQSPQNVVVPTEGFGEGAERSWHTGTYEVRPVLNWRPAQLTPRSTDAPLN
jgi:hypothetical protein